MSSNENKVSFYDFSKGVNYTKAPQELEYGNMVEIVNMIPDYRGKPLCARPFIGYSDRFQYMSIPQNDSSTVDITHIKSLPVRSGSAMFDVVLVSYVRISDLVVNGLTSEVAGTYVVAMNQNGTPSGDPIIISNVADYNIFSAILLDFSVVGIFFPSIGAKRITFNENGSFNPPVQIIDYLVPSGDGRNITLSNVVEHQGRVFGIGIDGQVRYCATEGEWLYNQRTGTWDKAAERYEIWGTRDLVNGTMKQDGGGIFVEPISTKTTALRSSQDGLIVFKDRSTSIWTYDSDGNPGDSSNGAEIYQLSDSIGCVDPESIIGYDGDIFFVGISQGRRKSIYKISGTEVTNVSVALDRKLSYDKNYMTAIYDGILYFFEIGGTILAALNLFNGAFSSMTSEYVKNIRSIAIDYVSPIMITEEGGSVVFYEFDGIVDDSTIKIHLEFPDASLFLENNKTVEYKTRKLFIDTLFAEQTDKEYSSYIVPGKEGVSLADHVVHHFGDAIDYISDIPSAEVGYGYAFVGKITTNDTVNIQCGDIQAELVDTFAIEKDYVLSTYDGNGLFYADESGEHPQYYENHMLFEGEYLNQRCRNINLIIDVETMGHYALNGVDIVFRECGSIV